MRLSAECANLEFDSGSVSFPLNTNTSVAINASLNLRNVLGDMYNKYNKYIIILNSFGGFASTTVSYGGSAAAGAVYSIGITGDLDFISNSVNGVASNIGYFPTRLPLPSNGSAFTNSTMSNGIVFVKPLNDVVNISIVPYLIRNGTVAYISATINALYDFNYSFTIYGLSE